MASVLEGMFGIEPGQVMIYVALALALTALYSALSGLWGVAVTDVFQFVLAMTGTIVLAVVVLELPQIGGMAGLLEKVPGWSLSFFPAISQEAALDSTGTFTLSAGAFSPSSASSGGPAGTPARSRAGAAMWPSG